MAQLFEVPKMSRIKNYSSIKQMEAQGQVVLDDFVYIAKVDSIASGETKTININIEADSDFILDKRSFFAAIAGAAQTDSGRVIPLINMATQDSGSGRLLQSQPVPVSAICGNGELPFVLAQPRVFSANSTINFTFTNTSAATTYTDFSVALVGRKVFKY
jgi:hypothetical protein